MFLNLNNLAFVLYFSYSWMYFFKRKNIFCWKTTKDTGVAFIFGNLRTAHRIRTVSLDLPVCKSLVCSFRVMATGDLLPVLFPNQILV